MLPATQTSRAYTHDAFGHGIFGLCHIDGALILDPSNSMMSGGPGVTSGQISMLPTNLDRAVIGDLFASGLNPGDGRQRFVDAGLVDK